MDRMQERTSREESRPESLECWHCQSCGEICAEVTRCTWDTDLMVGACCAVTEDRDELCTCQMSGDSFDPRGCYAHNGQPDYRQVAIEAIRKQAVRVTGQYNESEVA